MPSWHSISAPSKWFDPWRALFLGILGACNRLATRGPDGHPMNPHFP